MNLVCRILLLLNCLFTLLVVVFTSSGAPELSTVATDSEVLTTQRQKFVSKVKIPVCGTKIGVTVVKGHKFSYGTPKAL